MNKATGQVYRPAGKNAWKENRHQNGIDCCKLETCAYISFAAIWGLTAMDKIIVAG